MPTISRRNTHLNTYYVRVQSNNECVYCGESADEWDHVLPISVAENILRAGKINKYEQVLFIVQTCRECNMIAGSTAWLSIESKRNFIQERLVEKYRKYLPKNFWRETEIQELGPNLERVVRVGQRQASKLIRRVNWRGLRTIDLIISAKDARKSFIRHIKDKNSAAKRVGKNGTIVKENSSLKRQEKQDFTTINPTELRI